jgi:cytochrome c2
MTSGANVWNANSLKSWIIRDSAQIPGKTRPGKLMLKKWKKKKRILANVVALLRSAAIV